ncbi:ATP-binding cassette domain-containing protein [Treponema pedis]|uniref:Nickel import system ATP-binding protein NikD n=1 Tax=Treponema pedis TaxID=409322 RepID=A0A7S6WQ10_9SPIR|nr:ABC transporter ATP-binding protein [Treponema pedis]QOW60984.1 ABC transporter ATP-binding protein [Treponema pedis]
MSGILEIHNLNIDFLIGNIRKKIIKNISLHIENEIFAIMGETGCGKSVLAGSVLGLLPSNAIIEGSILYNGKVISKLSEKEYNVLRGKEIGLVPQSSLNALNPLLKIKKQIVIPIKAHKLLKTRAGIHSYSENLLQSLSLKKDVLNMYPFQLSGGMQHRVTAALGLSCKPSLLIFDEPTRGMDMVLRNSYASLIYSIYKKQNIAILLITHDLELAQKLSHRCALMYNGEIIEQGKTEELFKNKRSKYFQSLLEAMPKNMTRRNQR